MKPLERLNRICEIMQSFAFIVGLDLLNDTSRRNARRDFIFFFLICNEFVSLYIFFSNYPDFGEMLQILFVIMTGLQGLFRFTLIVVNLKSQYESLVKVREVYEANDNSSIERQEVLKQSLKTTETITKIVIGLYFIFVTGYPLFCLTYNYIFIERLLPYPLKIPFVDISTPSGYRANITNQMVASVGGFFLFSFFDLILILMVTHTITLTNLFKCKLDEFTKELEKIVKTDESFEKTVKKLMKEIVEEHRMYNAFITTFLGHASPQCFTIISLSFLGIATCLITALIGTYYSAIGIFLMNINQMFVACLIGAIISSQVSQTFRSLIFIFKNMFLSERSNFTSLGEFQMVQAADF